MYHGPVTVECTEEGGPALALIDGVVDQTVGEAATPRKGEERSYVGTGANTNTDYPTHVVSKVDFKIRMLWDDAFYKRLQGVDFKKPSRPHKALFKRHG